MTARNFDALRNERRAELCICPRSGL